MKKVLLILIAAVAFISASAHSDTTYVSLQVGGNPKSAFITAVDQVTGSTISSTVSNVVIQNNNPEIATVAANYPTTQPNRLTATPVASGTGTANVSCNIVYVDPGDGLQKNETKTLVVQYTVTGSPHGINLSATFN